MSTYMDHVLAIERREDATKKIDDIFNRIQSYAKEGDVNRISSLLGDLRTQITNLVRAIVDESVSKNRLKEEAAERIGPAD